MISQHFSVSIQVTDGDLSPWLGHNYTLTCEVTPVTANVTNYKWIKDGQTLQNDSREIFFSVLSLADGGLYTCQVFLESMVYSRVKKLIIEIQSKFTHFYYTKHIIICSLVPAETSIILTVMSDKSNPIWPNGSDVTLSCIVILSPVTVADLPLLNVDVQLSRNGISLNLTNSLVTGTTFINTVQLESFGRNNSGNYTCTATVLPLQNFTYVTGNSSDTRYIVLSTGSNNCFNHSY